MQQFVKAWIASASWIRTHTPHSFQEALEGLEGWAAQAAAQAAQSTAPQPVEQRPTPAAKPDSKDLDASLNTLFQAFSKLSVGVTALLFLTKAVARGQVLLMRLSLLT